MAFNSEQSKEFYGLLNDPKMAQSPSGQFVRTPRGIVDTTTGSVLASSTARTGTGGAYEPAVISSRQAEEAVKKGEEVMNRATQYRYNQAGLAQGIDPRTGQPVSVGDPALNPQYSYRDQSTKPKEGENLTSADVIALKESGTYTDNNFTQNADGSFSLKLTGSPADTAQAEYKKTVDNTAAQYDRFTGLFDEVFDTQIKELKSAMQEDVALQEEINRRQEKTQETVGFTLGTTRYSPTVQAGIMADVSSRGAQKISAIKQKYLGAIAEAQTAKINKEWDVFVKKTDDIKNYQKEALTEARKIAEEQRKVLEKKSEEVALLRQESMVGITIDTMMKDGKAPSRSEIMELLGGVVPSKVVDDYLDRLQSETGATSVDYNTLKTILGKAPTLQELLEYTKKIKEEGRAPRVIFQEKTDEYGNRVRTPFILDEATNTAVPTTGGIGTMTTSEENIPSYIQNAISDIGGRQYIDGSKLFGNQRNVATTIADKVGVPFVTKENATTVKEAAVKYQSSKALIDKLSDMSSKLITAEGIGSWAQAGKLKLEVFARSGLGFGQEQADLAKTYLDTVKSFATPIAKGTGQVGVLTEKDIETITDALPKASDTIGVAKMKMENIDTVLRSVLDAALDVYIGKVSTQKLQEQGKDETKTTGDAETAKKRYGITY